MATKINAQALLHIIPTVANPAIPPSSSIQGGGNVQPGTGIASVQPNPNLWHGPAGSGVIPASQSPSPQGGGAPVPALQPGAGQMLPSGLKLGQLAYHPAVGLHVKVG